MEVGTVRQVRWVYLCSSAHYFDGTFSMVVLTMVHYAPAGEKTIAKEQKSSRSKLARGIQLQARSFIRSSSLVLYI
jgi:hypothetical protein